MNEMMLDLGKRVLDSGNFKWREGMLAWNGSGYERFCNSDTWDYSGSMIPDLSDPATVGCAIAVLRDVFDDETVCVYALDLAMIGTTWIVTGMPRTYARGASESIALTNSFEESAKPEILEESDAHVSNVIEILDHTES
jgi:hypothetical protein